MGGGLWSGAVVVLLLPPRRGRSMHGARTLRGGEGVGKRMWCARALPPFVWVVFCLCVHTHEFRTVHRPRGVCGLVL